MKLSKNYLLRKEYEQFVLIPVGQAIIDHKQMIKLNETGYHILEYLSEDISREDLIDQFMTDYEVEEEEKESFISLVNEFLTSLLELGAVLG